MATRGSQARTAGSAIASGRKSARRRAPRSTATAMQYCMLKRASNSERGSGNMRLS